MDKQLNAKVLLAVAITIVAWASAFVVIRGTGPYFTGGALARIGFEPRGRLEFREVLSRRCLLAAVHDFRPRLPWRLYRATQAVAHLFVMRLFGRHLARLAERPPTETPELLSRQINLD